MHTKQEIVENWLPRYTGQELKDFGQYILLCNFGNYVKLFADMHKMTCTPLPIYCLHLWPANVSNRSKPITL